MTEKISGIYKITNTITGDFYIGSSKNVKHRWTAHKCQYTWNKCPDNPMYLDMKRYGLDYFEFQIVEEVESDSLKEKEQQFIEKLQPTYNNNRANGWDFERYKKYQKEFYKEHNNQLCSYNGETLTFSTLAMRFQRAGIPHPKIEAKKYLIL